MTEYELRYIARLLDFLIEQIKIIQKDKRNKEVYENLLVVFHGLYNTFEDRFKGVFKNDTENKIIH